MKDARPHRPEVLTKLTEARPHPNPLPQERVCPAKQTLEAVVTLARAAQALVRPENAQAVIEIRFAAECVLRAEMKPARESKVIEGPFQTLGPLERRETHRHD